MFALPKTCLLAVLAVLAVPRTAEASDFSVSIRSSRGSSSYGAHLGSDGFGLHVSHGRIRRGPSAAQRIYVPGHHEDVVREVWVPGQTKRVWVPPEYQVVHDSCGRRREILVRPGYWREHCEPGHFETRSERVWVPGHWKTVRY